MSNTTKKVSAYAHRDAVHNDNALPQAKEPVWGWLQSKPAYAIWCHAVEDWRKEGKQDPMLLQYPSSHTAEEAQHSLEADYGIKGTVLGSVVVIETEEGGRLEELFDRERIHHLFASKLRSAIQHWRNDGETNTIVMEFSSSQEVCYAWEELFHQYGIQGEATEEGTTLGIPAHYANFISQQVGMDNTPAKGSWAERVKGSMRGQRLSLA